jgi:hypothetical protein
MLMVCELLDVNKIAVLCEENMYQYQTGYFANFTRPYQRTKVHVVDIDTQPICGSVISEYSEYFWCSHNIELAYIDCKKCKKIVKSMLVSGIRI